ncbi:hypothetical protein [Rhodococcus globerulus]|uniref:Uncharacterized protein n=1 Tax=Rhodococcus globerulus TaxID=33008 RepID=A0ABU4C380_RHOGO|nr:hypothetical protein [Rhodococcus globerulus]MDV6270961.1 hypothetical protein [Rhodococcus globerulus]
MSAISDLVYQMATAQMETPALDGSDAGRWAWFADLYDNPQWGLAATIPNFNEAGGSVGRLCRATTTCERESLMIRWEALSRLAAIKRTESATAEHHAWTAVINSGVDVHDLLDDIEYGGTETVTSAFSAIISAHSDVNAEKFIAQATNAWESYRTATQPLAAPLFLAASSDRTVAPSQLKVAS